MSPPRVSVLLAVKDSQLYLRRCLNSLLEQTVLEQCEVVVIDGGGDDEDFKVLDSVASHFPRLTYFRTEPRGVYAAWNEGIRRTEGEFLLNLNSDDTLYPEAIARLSQVLETRPEVGLVYGDSLVEPSGEVAPFANAPGLPKDPLLNCRCGPHPMWRRSLHDELGYFDETLEIAADFDFWVRIGSRFPIFHLEQRVGTFLRREDSISSRDRWATRAESLLVLRRYFSIQIPDRNFLRGC